MLSVKDTREIQFCYANKIINIHMFLKSQRYLRKLGTLLGSKVN